MNGVSLRYDEDVVQRVASHIGSFMRGTAEERFKAYTVRGEGDACWGWIGPKHNQGYGRLFMNGKNIYAHRGSWILHYGPIPDGLDVLHRCDNPPCTRPDHLFLGTHADNMRDMKAKGRLVPPQHNNRKLTADQVETIRRIGRAMTTRALAANFGVSQPLITNIINGKAHKSA